MCLECLEAKVTAYPYSELERCATIAKDNAAFRAAFLECSRFRREGGRRSWNETEVATSRNHSIRLERHYLAFTRRSSWSTTGWTRQRSGPWCPKRP